MCVGLCVCVKYLCARVLNVYICSLFECVNLCGCASDCNRVFVNVSVSMRAWVCLSVYVCVVMRMCLCA